MTARAVPVLLLVYRMPDPGRSYTKMQQYGHIQAHERPVLCIDHTEFENDTQYYEKSCVSFFDIGISIHKREGPEPVFGSWTNKNVYDQQRSADSYTTDLQSICRFIHNRPAIDKFLCPEPFLSALSPGLLRSGPMPRMKRIPLRQGPRSRCSGP